VLVLFSGSRLLPANILFDESLRQSLASRAAGPFDCCGEFLDEVDFPDRYDERMLDLLREKYQERTPDVVVTFAPPSLEFYLRHRSQLFADAPIVFASVNASLGGGATESGITGVRSSFDASATLHLALSLHPRTRQVFAIPDVSGTDSTRGAKTLLRAGELPIPLHILERQPLPQLLTRLRGLPENSLVIDLAGFDSSIGSRAPPDLGAMQRMSEASRAPIYGMTDPLVENGLVGAVTTPMDSLGRATAELVLRVVSRDKAGELPPVKNLEAAALFDWRQLQRWGVRTADLPAGSVVRFKPPSFWRQHLLLVVTTGALFLLQTGLILALVLQSRRRRRAELDARRRREELAHMTRVATMGELTASLAHEINQPLAAILSNAQAAQRLLATGDGQVEEIQDILADIAADDQRAGEVIRRMRTLLRKEDPNPTEVDVNELVDEVVGLVGGEMILQNVSLALDLSSRVGRVHGDRVQLQQVLLNLIVNALDAMKEVEGGGRRVLVRTVAAGPRSVEVSVQDTGAGIAADKLDQIFEPFVTTKPHGMGLGLSICRSIIQAHGGRIGSKTNADRGTTFWFTLPTLDEAKP
jgi:signal transduction histidine kinase